MKLHAPFVQLPILFDAAALADEVLSIEESAWRGRTAQNDGNSALTLITANGDPDSEALSGEMRPTPSLARCPYVMQVLQTLGATWGRTRLMRLSGQAEVKPHVDTNYYWRERMRVHVPIITTASVRFQCGDGEINMAAGECWIFDTWRRHRVLNEGNETRIHLVADTVGGEHFWDLLRQGRPAGQDRGSWDPSFAAPIPGPLPALDFESVNSPQVMSPWEVREHIVFLLAEAVPDPRLASIQSLLLQFSRRWHALWACYGERQAGWPRYRALLDGTKHGLMAIGAGQLGLRNEVGLMQALSAYVFEMALADRDPAGSEAGLDRHGISPELSTAVATSPPASASARRSSPQEVFERPVFIVSPPRSGSTLLFETLSTAADLFTVGDESHQLIEGVPGLAPSQRGYESNRLLRQDATPEVAAALRSRFLSQLRDRSANSPDGMHAIRMLEKTPKNALRIPFLKTVFPEARFIYLHRDPRQVLASMLEGWKSERFQMYPQLPGWQGPVWSFLLTPGWRESNGQPLEEVVAQQWETAVRILLDDLEQLEKSDWIAVEYGRFLSDPQAEAERLAAWAGWSWDRVLDRQLPLSRYTLSPPDAEKWRKYRNVIEALLGKRFAIANRAAQAAIY